MKKVIYNLRNQPEKIRRRILHISTVAFAIILILLWIYSLGTSLTNPDTATKVNNDLKPLNTLKANIISGYQSFRGPQ